MPAKFFGQFLLERGKILKEELLDALEYQKNINVKLGTIALDANYLTAEQIESIHLQQQQTDKLFGEIAIELGLLTPPQLEELLLIQRNEHIHLGEALLQKGYLTLQGLEIELSEYKKTISKLEDRAYQAIRDLKNPKLAEAFLDTTIKLLKRVGDLHVNVAHSHQDPNSVAPYLWNVYHHFWGDIEGIYILSLDEGPFLRLASKFAQEEMTSIDEMAKDAVKEFTNIVVGNSATKLSHEKVKLNFAPAKISPSATQIEIPENLNETIAVSLPTGNANLEMSLMYRS